MQAQKHSSGGHRSEGWGEKQKGSSISLSRHIFSVNGTKSYVARTYISSTLLPANEFYG